MDGDTTFGAWLKRRRRQLDLTQKGLGHRAGCSVGMIRKMEADERRPSRQLAALLAQHLGIPPDQHEPFIAFSRSEPYISDVSFPVLAPVEDQIPVIPQEDSAKQIKHNLPLATTPFVGRSSELAALDDLLLNPEVRLVTIVGPGGIGKTRMALAYAEQLVAKPTPQHPYPNGVFFVNLAALSEAERLIPTLAEALNFRMQGEAREKRSPKQQLLDYLHNRGLLLVLDNFEHLLSPPHHLEKEIDDGAALVAEILQTAPDVRILVTSRERLNLHMEQVFAIDGLTIPDWETGAPGADVEDVGEYTAVRLFLQAAQRSQQSFSLESDDERLALIRICHLVGGMPLALELAASWVDMLSLVDIAIELERGLDLLEAEMRDVPQRQRSVRASFDYSWGKLNEREQSVFAQLSIFRGGFTRPAVQAVTGATLQELSQLLNKSFIQFDKQRDRYQVHGLLRQYGAERLSQDSELETALQDRHSTYYCQALANHTNDLKGARQRQALSIIEADIENVRLAWNHAVMRQELADIGVSIESLYRFYWNQSTYLEEGINDFEKAAALLRTGERNRSGTTARCFRLVLFLMGRLTFGESNHGC